VSGYVPAEDSHGHARFIVYRRHQTIGTRSPEQDARWTPVQNSGVYTDPERAERDGLLEWSRLSKSQFSGMTTNERLFDAGLMGE
jgi:hypothetical protein